MAWDWTVVFKERSAGEGEREEGGGGGEERDIVKASQLARGGSKGSRGERGGEGGGGGGGGRGLYRRLEAGVSDNPLLDTMSANCCSYSRWRHCQWRAVSAYVIRHSSGNSSSKRERGEGGGRKRGEGRLGGRWGVGAGRELW